MPWLIGVPDSRAARQCYTMLLPFDLRWSLLTGLTDTPVPCLQHNVSKRVWECYDDLKNIEDLEAGIGVLGAFIQRWVDKSLPENRSDVRACPSVPMSACFAFWTLRPRHACTGLATAGRVQGIRDG